MIAIMTVRIIPARAGFTTISRASSQDMRDHPRSRGVYLVLLLVVIRVGGSSPLARGLQFRNCSRATGARIIPARAGFTINSPTYRRPGGDHPRSRGVYVRGHPCPDRYRGSSPLARGLPGRVQESTAQRGIIPARAGFTHHRPADRPDERDHPRSRGVYTRHIRST